MNKVIAITGKQRFTTNIRSGQHSIIADEPLAVGGEDLGFAPQELLASALAACTSITLTMYAKRKEWFLEEVKVEITLERNANTNTTTFQRNVQIKGELDEKQRIRLLSVANACPIHKILTGSIEVETDLNLI